LPLHYFLSFLCVSHTFVHGRHAELTLPSFMCFLLADWPRLVTTDPRPRQQAGTNASI
jgi:hypothetical protein